MLHGGRSLLLIVIRHLRDHWYQVWYNLNCIFPCVARGVCVRCFGDSVVFVNAVCFSNYY